jgi:hypothetical protein
VSAELPPLAEGWYLMSVRDLEVELARHRDPSGAGAASGARPLTIEEALAYRSAGNLPDEDGRSLRLVLFVDEEPLSEKRLRYEPDFHAAPSWRTDGSKPVNVVPLITGPRPTATAELPWWEQPDVAPLETEWQHTGAVDGLAIPAGFRSFVFKTIVSLRAAGIDVDARTIVDSVSRWLSPQQVAQLERAFGNEE